MLEAGNFGCADQVSGCTQTGPPVEDRTQFAMWAIVSAPLVLSFDMSKQEAMDRVWPVLSNSEVIAVNQAWHGSPGQLLLTDRTVFPSPPNAAGFHVFPGQLGQARGWQDVRGMTDSDPGWQVGPCVDPWGSAACPHYMTLHEASMSTAQADAWCNANSSCHGLTYATNATEPTACYFRDETQVFFMDSELGSISGPVGQSKWTSHIKAARAPPLSPTTSGVQVWVKDLGPTTGMALLLVNLGQATLAKYSLPLSKLPTLAASPTKARDLYTHAPYELPIAGGAIEFQGVAPHDSVFLVLR